MNLVMRLIKEEDGQGYLEYAVLIALVVILVAASAQFIGGAIGNYMGSVGNAIGTYSGNSIP